MSEDLCSSAYQLRGHRVPSVAKEDLFLRARHLCAALDIKRSSFTKKKIGFLIQQLESYGINIDPVEDHEWIDIAKAMINPSTMMICMPNSLYSDLHNAKPEAIRIYLHELGHIFLAHKPHLHFSNSDTKEIEDSEWQADAFADAIIDVLGLPMESSQLELDLKSI